MNRTHRWIEGTARRMCAALLSDVGLDDFLQTRGVGSCEFLDLDAVLDEHEGGHAGDVVLHGNIFTPCLPRNLIIQLSVETTRKLCKFPRHFCTLDALIYYRSARVACC